MNIFGNFWTRRERLKEKMSEQQAKPCMHATLVPHWDRAEDMGHNERAIFFICDSCTQIFSPDDVADLRQGRTRSGLSGPQPADGGSDDTKIDKL